MLIQCVEILSFTVFSHDVKNVGGTNRKHCRPDTVSGRTSKYIHVLSCPRPSESESPWGLGRGRSKHTILSVSVSVSSPLFWLGDQTITVLTPQPLCPLPGTCSDFTASESGTWHPRLAVTSFSLRGSSWAFPFLLPTSSLVSVASICPPTACSRQTFLTTLSTGLLPPAPLWAPWGQDVFLVLPHTEPGHTVYTQ